MGDYTRVVLESDLGGKRLTIACARDNGTGHGHRLFGPKFNNVTDNAVVKHELDAEDVRALETYCRIWHEINDARKPTTDEAGA